eukprot:NODE_224_length_12322_cov_0.795549.p10 type:complete len:175 gc:universal NODE_224_length_12322_cov_0.795549:9413-9937(+)
MNHIESNQMLLLIMYLLYVIVGLILVLINRNTQIMRIRCTNLILLESAAFSLIGLFICLMKFTNISKTVPCDIYQLFFPVIISLSLSLQFIRTCRIYVYLMKSQVETHAGILLRICGLFWNKRDVSRLKYLVLFVLSSSICSILDYVIVKYIEKEPWSFRSTLLKENCVFTSIN